MIKPVAEDIAKGIEKETESKKRGLFIHKPFVILNLNRKSFQLFFLKLLLISLAFFVAISILEIGLRLSEKKVYDLSSCQSLDENFHHVMVPDSFCRFKTNEWDIPYKINSLGLRGDEIKVQKAPDILRVLVLGDSFMQGYGVNFDKSFAKVLEKELNSINVQKRIEVVSTGVFGYSPLNEYLYLKERGINFSPDLVIQVFDPTDFMEDRQRFSELKLSYPNLTDEQIQNLIYEGLAKFNFSLINKAPSNTPQKVLLPGVSYQFKTYLKENVKTYKILVDFIKRKNKPEVAQDVINEGNPDLDILAIERGNKITDNNWESLWPLPVKHLSMMKKLLEDKNIPFVVMIIPDPSQISDSEWKLGRKVLGMPSHYVDLRKPFEEELSFRLGQEKIQSFSLLDDFRANNQGPFYFDYDGHWRESGHKLAGSLMASFLLKNPSLESLFKSE